MRVWRATLPGAIALLALAPAAPDAQVPARPGLEAYFASREPGVQTGGVRMVPIRTPRGTNGFGYDPIFVPDGDSRTTGEMSPAEKDAISHRGRAFRAMAQQLDSLLGD